MRGSGYLPAPFPPKIPPPSLHVSLALQPGLEPGAGMAGVGHRPPRVRARAVHLQLGAGAAERSYSPYRLGMVIDTWGDGFLKQQRSMSFSKALIGAFCDPSSVYCVSFLVLFHHRQFPKNVPRNSSQNISKITKFKNPVRRAISVF